jgi:NAD(P)-dependent dehydrogenase (short-subunit alcohol dehydrogenase family)
MVRTAVSRLGPVDVLVNNAAIADGDDVLEIDEATWDRDVAVVLKGVFLCSKAVLPSMIERRHGVILNIASVNGLSALGNEAYSAAKAGVINLTQGVAVRYGRHGIRCNAIAPGTIRTPIWQERIERDPAVFQRLVKWYPLGRVGEPDDVADAAMFMASDEASWITGVVLPVDGGLLAGNFRMTRELLAEAGSEELEP